MKTLVPLLLACSVAQAHVTLEHAEGQAGKPYKAVLRVGHGCEGSPTREIAVRIPAGVRGAKPMPKPGWTIHIERTALTLPYESHGKTVREDVSEIRWRANTEADELPDSQYDEFVLRATLPGEAGTLWFPVTQRCREGQWRWVEIPQPGQPKPRAPAAKLEVLAPAAAAPVHVH